MIKKPHIASDVEKARGVLSRTQAPDFTGETRFIELTASEKLDALASMCAFVHEFKGKAGKEMREAK